MHIAPSRFCPFHAIFTPLPKIFTTSCGFFSGGALIFYLELLYNAFLFKFGRPIGKIIFQQVLSKDNQNTKAIAIHMKVLTEKVLYIYILQYILAC